MGVEAVLEGRMRETILALLLTGMWPGLSLYAQSVPQGSSLTPAEWEGKKMFQQRCSLCHTPPAPGDKIYGPMLSGETVAGKEAAVRALILQGTQRMPGFQYGLEPKEIDNIIAYLKTVQKTDPKKQQN